MDQGLDELIREEAPTQMMNLILQQQHQKLFEGHIIDKYDCQDWIQWVEIEEKERTTGYVIKSPPYVHITIEIEPLTNMSNVGDR